ncbi:hypothetical protein M3Y98_01198100 [Aphelenchoides besseyi]|nr:hypothetical protein M3Y98_01198100 [Aphelenchoides besseyi]KAI6193141.1 hypothetical protein M3Y96_00986800 [Aphelenchoides besseyi]
MAEKTERSRLQLHTLLLNESRLGHSKAETARNICKSMGDGTVSSHTATNWFYKFKNHNFCLEDREHTDRFVEIDEDRLLALIEEDLRRSTREVEVLLNCDHQTINLHLHRLGSLEIRDSKTVTKQYDN